MRNKTIEIAYTLFKQPKRFTTLFSVHSDPTTDLQQACFTLKQLAESHKSRKLSLNRKLEPHPERIPLQNMMISLIHEIDLQQSLNIEHVICHQDNLSKILYDQRRMQHYSIAI
ncbi:hypothetical protein [Thaumasiovibrio subtropicus]|uniref:hypothetical protein n=1 Tax=Thaumasiovibrio subtropicus TaxID=1891207 RepID=UPI000B34B49C|nr:hypothetical protein [Thaumasiovibrio subtropicus]